MAADGEILNKPLLQRMANYFNLGGVRRSPGFLNMDDVKAVYVLGQEEQPVYSLGKSFPEPFSLSAIAAFDLAIAGPAGGGVLGQFYANDNYALDLVGLDVDLQYSEAGATSDNATVISLYITRYENYGSFNQNIIYWDVYWQTIQTGRLNYRFGLGGFNKGTAWNSLNLPSLHIPRGDRMNIVIGRPSGGVFPDLTTINIQGHAFTNELQPQLPYSFPV